MNFKLIFEYNNKEKQTYKIVTDLVLFNNKIIKNHKWDGVPYKKRNCYCHKSHKTIEKISKFIKNLNETIMIFDSLIVDKKYRGMGVSSINLFSSTNEISIKIFKNKII